MWGPTVAIASALRWVCGSLTGVLYPELLEGSSCRLGFYPLKGNQAEQDESCVIEGDFLPLS